MSATNVQPGGPRSSTLGGRLVDWMFGSVEGFVSEATPAKRSRSDRDAVSAHERVAELEEELSAVKDQILELQAQLTGKNVELSTRLENMNQLTKLLNDYLVNRDSLRCELEEISRQSSSQDKIIKKLELEAQQSLKNISDLEEETVVVSDCSDFERLEITNFNLQSDLEKESSLVNELKSKLDSSRQNRRVLKLESELKELQNQITHKSRKNEKDIANCLEQIKLLTRERNALKASQKSFEKANDRYRTQRDELKTELANIRQSPMAANDGLSVNSVQVGELREQLNGKIVELAKSLDRVDTLTNLNRKLQSQLDEKSSEVHGLNEHSSSLYVHHLKLEKELSELRVDKDKEIAKRNDDMKTLKTERDALVAKIKNLEKDKDRYQAQRDEYRAIVKMSNTSQTTMPVSDVQFVNPEQGIDLRTRLKPNFDIIRELFKNGIIDHEMFIAAKNSHLEFLKFYPDCNDLTVIRTAYHILVTAINKLRDANLVLILIECPFVVLCLKTFYLDCTFFIKKMTFNKISHLKFQFGVYEDLDRRTDADKFDLVLTDQDYVENDVRVTYMMKMGSAFNCVTGVRTYLRRGR